MSEFPQNSSPDDKPRLVVVVPVILVCLDRKSTRLNFSHLVISYAVFCLKKKNDHNLAISGPLQTTPDRLNLTPVRFPITEPDLAALTCHHPVEAARAARGEIAARPNRDD